MLLTLKQPAHNGFKSFHDYSPPTPPSNSRFSPALPLAGPNFPHTQLTSTLARESMSTPHRGLPPPAAMAQGAPVPASSQPLSQYTGALPAPPSQWQGSEENMRNWLQAKVEEDRRRQEEEKTQQENLRLEQRRIEHEILRTSLTGGIPPHLIPMVFVGMSGGNAQNMEWTQQYILQAQQAQQQQLQIQQQQQHQALPPPQGPPSPELRRESRQIAHVYSGQQHQGQPSIPSTPMGASAPPLSSYSHAYPGSPTQRSRTQLPAASTLIRAPATTHLPRLNTGEMQIQQPPPGPSSMQIVPAQPAHAAPQQQAAGQQQGQQGQQEPHSSPSNSIYFHHWQPPTSQGGGTGGGTSSQQPSTPSDVYTSPRKRKAQGPQQPAPPPTTLPQYTSPSFSQAGSSASETPSARRAREHSRQRSDHSSRGPNNYGRPSSRHRHPHSSSGAQGTTTPPETTSFESSRSAAGAHAPGPLREHEGYRTAASMDPRQLPPPHERRYSGGSPEMKREEGQYHHR